MGVLLNRTFWKGKYKQKKSLLVGSGWVKEIQKLFISSFLLIFYGNFIHWFQEWSSLPVQWNSFIPSLSMHINCPLFIERIFLQNLFWFFPATSKVPNLTVPGHEEAIFLCRQAGNQRVTGINFSLVSHASDFQTLFQNWQPAEVSFVIIEYKSTGSTEMKDGYEKWLRRRQSYHSAVIFHFCILLRLLTFKSGR